MNFFTDTFEELFIYKDIKKAINTGITPVLCSGLAEIHTSQCALTLAKKENTTVLLICQNDGETEKFVSDINYMAGENIAAAFPSKEWVLTPVDSASSEYVRGRISALAALCSGKISIIAASAESLLQPTIPQKELIKNTFVVKTGNACDKGELVAKLIDAGYSISETVEGEGQISSRGDLLDIFPISAKNPVRIEFWGDEIDSISNFDIESQRRDDEKLDFVSISPAGEVLYDKEELAAKIDDYLKKLRGNDSEKIKENCKKDIEKIQNGMLSYPDKYYDFVYGQKSSILDYGFGAVLCYDFNAVKHAAKGAEKQYMEDLENYLSDGILFKGTDEYFIPFEKSLSKLLSMKSIFISAFVQGTDNIQYKQIFSLECMQNAPWGGEMRQLDEDLKNYIEDGYRIYLAAGSEKTLPMIKEDLEKEGIKCRLASDISSGEKYDNGVVILSDGALSSGFSYPENKTAVITQAKAMKSRKRRKRYKEGKSITSLSDIQKGDLVVHSMYGIGKFTGIKQLELEGIIKDYITIEYAGNENLFVPITQMDMVTRYIGGGDDENIKLNKLSSSEWQKAKTRTRKAVKDIAKQLIAVYAKRQQAQGFAFFPDDETQREFENRFPYVETDDQIEATEEIKSDMESVRPMDRLLCGDVGFGKTEVALRASMKCILSGKQCAILAPTTVLAWQHYQTAVRRFEPFAVKVELLSRFRSAKEQKEVLEGLKKGSVDLVIGTHRLIQKDVEFHDLGLAIIDEEQRFGVAHKEKFKKLFAGIDVLTLSATPIPRTLNMAMSGIRDMSVLNEPPQDRHPVQTYVLEYSDGIIMQAINRELRRGGQVYYLHNRVETIEIAAQKLQNMFPDANIAVAHGRLDEREMSEIWQSVVNHETDILVCTTIIETGIDVANVNTLIIEDSDRFGLSQLYQLRGRVGRSSRRAYAYFTYRKNKVLTEIASKRLHAMKEFTAFGSGFRIALRDLELRGAGNLLGGQQSGHMEAVGYDMYMKMLEQAIAEEKGTEIKRASECVIDLQIDAHIPEKYIESLPQRLEIYRKIAAVDSEEARMELVDELCDRYGEPPKSVMGLITIAQMRNRAADVGINEISQRGNKIIIYAEHLSPQGISALSVEFHGRISFANKGRRSITVEKGRKEDSTEVMKKIVEILERK